MPFNITLTELVNLCVNLQGFNSDAITLLLASVAQRTQEESAPIVQFSHIQRTLSALFDASQQNNGNHT